ncbi:hypothetical protein NLB33_23425 [Mycolicibacterium smegmatis]|uniref:hypothetical protein n=1 Tax=Mycolicibacterium TaxID=1866885 RepID=UPI001BDCFE9D|nr:MULTISPECIES: hypothetical protein [Mycolicibacterium]MBU8810165.1 hypothetical protein [Mycolicibacterium goodii]MBU8816410.1 hypothetical protein [Mycolicibacterium goodii]MBU8833844.1 hypothetical protein [Mycolicibacterium goodii]MCP2625803.1 hypothetical protein [Mycolicibacterium smegmatis]UGU32010.1 hypothetical protein LT350_03370 [Mycolicibacterium smegmatis]
MVGEFFLRSFVSVLWLWPVLLVVAASVWRTEVLIGRVLSGQAELKSSVEQARHEAARAYDLASEKSFVAWDVKRVGDDRIRVVNVGRDEARSVTVTASNSDGVAEQTVSSVPASRGEDDRTPGVAVELAGSGSGEVRVEITWRSPLGRWTTERQILH